MKYKRILLKLSGEMLSGSDGKGIDFESVLEICKEVKEVTPKIIDLIDDMIETMYEANGVGLAAP